MPTEWALQIPLTSRWAAEGADVLGRRHLLVAWEVMAPSWRINDSHGFFSEPSIDFLLVDATSQLRAVEVKPRLTESGAWAAGLQVTRRALLLHASYSIELLRGTHAACWSGAHGRLPQNDNPAPFEERFAACFGKRPSRARQAGPIERIVGAWSAAPGAGDVLAKLSAMDETELRELCAGDGVGGLRGRHEGGRLLAALDASRPMYREPIGLVTLPD